MTDFVCKLEAIGSVTLLYYRGYQNGHDGRVDGGGKIGFLRILSLQTEHT